MNIALLALLILAGLTALLLAFGRLRWWAAQKTLLARLDAYRRPLEGAVVTPHDLDRLPFPVQRYLKTVLPDGQRPVAAVEIEQTGTFNISETTERWKPFTARQRVVTQRPGFVWNARIALIPGLPAFVQDACFGGEGLLRVSICGLLSKVHLRGRGELARGELLRYLAEAAWYPTAFLPGQDIIWSPVDDHSANATLQDGDHSITLRFHFDAENLIDTVRAEARGRTAGTNTVSMPWQCRLWNYVTREGIRVPLEGEAAWMTPEGPKPYWRGKITAFRYEYTDDVAQHGTANPETPATT